MDLSIQKGFGLPNGKLHLKGHHHLPPAQYCLVLVLMCSEP